MKKYFLDNLTIIRKFWANQIAISLLGIMITWAMTTLKANNPSFGIFPELIACLFCGGFFCFLIYDVCYELGGKDYIRLSHNTIPYDSLKTAKITAFAYIPTVLCTIIAIVFFVIGFGDGYAVTSVIMNVAIHAMYSGFFFILPESINVIAFPISIFTTLFFAWLGYYLAVHDKSLRGLLGFKPRYKKE